MDSSNILVTRKEYQKMIFIMNALERGWKIKKSGNDKYVFFKKHEGKKEIFLESYLEKFVNTNIGNEGILKKYVI
jgi:hypothetical protein